MSSERGPGKVKAVVLVGGFGLRLRPLTFYRPKPLVEFMNKPMLYRILKRLKRSGIDEVILCTSFKSVQIEEYSRVASAKLGLDISISTEKYPLGTAGPLYLVKDLLQTAESFFLIFSDIICMEYPFSEMMEFHRRHSGSITILTTHEEDPSRYGVILRDEETGRIDEFVEKPKIFVSNTINAGIYLMDRSILDYLTEPVFVSMEREIFPRLVKRRMIYSMDINHRENFWNDCGIPEDFLRASMTYIRLKGVSRVVSPSAEVREESVVEDAVIGDGVTIGRGVLVRNSVVLGGAVIGDGSAIIDSIVGWKCRISRWTTVKGSVLGEGVKTTEGATLSDTKVAPFERR